MTMKAFFPLVLLSTFLLTITYYRFFCRPKNPIIGWVVQQIPLEFHICLIYLLCYSIFNGDVAWAEGTGHSCDPAELRQLSQPQVDEEVPPIPMEWGQQNVFVPDIPVLEQPLIYDESRRVGLFHRLGLHSFGQELPLKTIVDLVYQQAEIEKKIEAALVLDGIAPMRVFYELNRLRGVLFYPRGTPLSPATLARYLREIAQSGTRQSIPYRRVYRAIRNYELFIDLLFINRNNNQ